MRPSSQEQRTSFLIFAQMILRHPREFARLHLQLASSTHRVISSPSISTMGFSTLILETEEAADAGTASAKALRRGQGGSAIMHGTA
jgi:hypothetical protein